MLKAVTLEGERVRLEPLGMEHADALFAAANHPELWRITMSKIASRADAENYIRDALVAQDAGAALAFATLLRADNRVIGSTRFGNYDAANRRVEIGWTWLTPALQRTGANVEAKLLMLEHAFDVLRLNRVEFKTDVVNERSRAALRGIGATEEGVLRRHMVLWNGRIRDTVYFSIIREEWPAVRARLKERLARGRQS